MTGVEVVRPTSFSLFGADGSTLALFEAGAGSKLVPAWTEGTAFAAGMELGPIVSTLLAVAEYVDIYNILY